MTQQQLTVPHIKCQRTGKITEGVFIPFLNQQPKPQMFSLLSLQTVKVTFEETGTCQDIYASKCERCCRNNSTDTSREVVM